MAPVARYYVFPDQASAQVCVDGIDARARAIYSAQGYQVDGAGDIIGKRASDGALMPDAARTVTWDVPRQRLGGKWIVRHCEAVPGNGFVLDATQVPPLTVAQYVAQDIAASVAVETEDPSWWPVPSSIGAAV